MKYLFTAISVIVFSSNFCYSQARLSVLNRERTIEDTIVFSVKNQSTGTMDFNFSLEVFADGKWSELYDNIYEFDRDKVQRFKLLPSNTKNFKYPINKISTDYKKLYNGRPFRLVMNIFPADRLENQKKIKSASFMLSWHSKP